MEPGFLAREGLTGFKDRAVAWPGGVVDTAKSAWNAISSPFDTIGAIAGGIKDWITSPIPSHALEREFDKVATASAQQLGGMVFDTTTGLATAYIGGKAVEWIGGKWVDAKAPGDTVVRSDNDFSSPVGGNGKPKAYINENGDLVPPNPEGTGSVQTHVRGGGSENSPYISVTDPRAASNPKDYGTHQIEIDVTRLQQDIDSGVLPNTRFLSNREIAAELQSRVDAAREKYTNAPSTKNETSLTRAEADLRNATRDGECLIKGCVPANYIKFIDK
jgi:filamentous hemagglutinin